MPTNDAYSELECIEKLFNTLFGDTVEITITDVDDESHIVFEPDCEDIEFEEDLELEEDLDIYERVDDIEEDVAIHDHRLDTAEDDIEDINVEIELIEDSLSSYTNEIDTLKDTDDNILKKLENIEKELADIKNRLSIVESRPSYPYYPWTTNPEPYPTPYPWQTFWYTYPYVSNTSTTSIDKTDSGINNSYSLSSHANSFSDIVARNQ